jgi:hypothetical protein
MVVRADLGERADRGNEFLIVERFQHDTAQVHARGTSVPGLQAPAQDGDRDGTQSGIVANSPAQFQPRHSGHVEVGEHDVGMVQNSHSQSSSTVRGGKHRKAGPLKEPRKDKTDIVVVLGYEHYCHGQPSQNITVDVLR